MVFKFGVADYLNPDDTLIALIGLITFLITFEFLTGAIEYMLKHSQIYNQMLQKIYKELMINGFISFVLTIYQASHEKAAARAYNWYSILHFVDYLVFFVAIFFVLHSVYIMIVSIQATKLYEKYHILTVSDILVELNDVQTNIFSQLLFDMRYLPFSTIRSKVEFKIIYALFRDTYWLPNDFDYGMYLSNCFQHYSLKVINIGFSSWLIMMALGCLNYLRVLYGNEYTFNCPHTDSEYSSDQSHESHRYMEEAQTNSKPHSEDHACIKKHVELFVVCGMLICCYAILLYAISVHYMAALMVRAGVTSTGDYQSFLTFEESSLLNVEMKRRIEIQLPDKTKDAKKDMRKRRMSITTFRRNVDCLIHEETMASGGDKHEEVYRQISRVVAPHFRGSMMEGIVKDVKFHCRRIANKLAMRDEAFSEVGDRASSSQGSATGGEKHLIFKEDSDSDSEGGGKARPSSSEGGGQQELEHSSSGSSSSEDEQAEKVGVGGGADEEGEEKQAEGVTATAGRRSVGSVSDTKAKDRKNGRRKNFVLKRRSSCVLTLGGGPLAQVSSNKMLLPAGSSSAVNTSNSKLTDSGANLALLMKSNSSMTAIEKIAQLAELGNLSSIEKMTTKARTKALRAQREKALDMKLTEDFSDVYFFGKPALYFRAVEVAITMNSMYLALWATNFIKVVNDSTMSNKSWWHLVMIVPLLFVLPCLGEIVRTSSLLSAIAELDLNVIGMVLEDQQSKSDLVKELCDKVKMRIQGSMLHRQVILNNLYDEIDVDGSGSIDSSEFRDMLRALHLHYSDDKFRQLFQCVDRNRDGFISKDEFYFVVFPKEAEEDKLKMRSDVVEEQKKSIAIQKKREAEMKKMSSWRKLSVTIHSLGKLDAPNMLFKKSNSNATLGSDGDGEALPPPQNERNGGRNVPGRGVPSIRDKPKPVLKKSFTTPIILKRSLSSFILGKPIKVSAEDASAMPSDASDEGYFTLSNDREAGGETEAASPAPPDRTPPRRESSSDNRKSSVVQFSDALLPIEEQHRRSVDGSEDGSDPDMLA